MNLILVLLLITTVTGVLYFTYSLGRRLEKTKNDLTKEKARAEAEELKGRYYRDVIKLEKELGQKIQDINNADDLSVFLSGVYGVSTGGAETTPSGDG